jgi:hypothetical protein
VLLAAATGGGAVWLVLDPLVLVLVVLQENLHRVQGVVGLVNLGGVGVARH